VVSASDSIDLHSAIPSLRCERIKEARGISRQKKALNKSLDGVDTPTAENTPNFHGPSYTGNPHTERETMKIEYYTSLPFPTPPST